MLIQKPEIFHSCVLYNALIVLYYVLTCTRAGRVLTLPIHHNYIYLPTLSFLYLCIHKDIVILQGYILFSFTHLNFRNIYIDYESSRNHGIRPYFYRHFTYGNIPKLDGELFIFPRFWVCRWREREISPLLQSEERARAARIETSYNCTIDKSVV